LSYLSVIIPTYNRKDLLIRALDSVFAQNYADFELIVIDDGSTDGTSELGILNDKRVKNFRFNENGGVSRARNKGVSLSTGEWIIFLDSDDEWMPQKLFEQVKWAHGNPDFKILQTQEIWIRNGKRVNPPRTHLKQGGDIFRISLERCMITPSSVMIKRELFLKSGGFNESLPACEDYDLWLRISRSHPVGLVDKSLLIRYGGHLDQLSSSVPALDRFRIRSLLGLLFEGGLSDEQEMLVKSTLVAKSEIISQGYLKRGNNTLYERYKSIVDNYR
jgi:glycosyltransferase involved in cell wall biosynthesis